LLSLYNFVLFKSVSKIDLDAQVAAFVHSSSDLPDWPLTRTD